MANHLHDTRDLVRCHETSPFTFSDDLVGHFVLLGLEDRRLVKADCGCVDAHIGEDNIHIIHSARESEMIRQRKCDMQKNIVMAPVPLPKLAVEIMVVVLGLRPVNVYQVSTKQTS